MSAPKQEVAPPGGYPAVRIARYLPKKGFTGLQTLAIVSTITLAGLWKYGIEIQKVNEIRLARYKERYGVLDKLDDAHRAWIQEEVKRQAFEDAKKIDKLYKEHGL